MRERPHQVFDTLIASDIVYEEGQSLVEVLTDVVQNDLGLLRAFQLESD